MDQRSNGRLDMRRGRGVSARLRVSTAVVRQEKEARAGASAF